MNGFDAILSQDRPIRILTRFLDTQTIPHALLFTGAEGVGKRMTAMTFAMAANCLENGTGGTLKTAIALKEGRINQNPLTLTAPCGLCGSCKKIKSFAHPDVLMVEPSGVLIKIDRIREVIKILTLKPFEARVRVVIIAQSHAMNPSAANALLKVLEEPPDRTVLILTAKETSDLLPTLVSRCRHIRFNLISDAHLCELLEKNAMIESDCARVLSAMAGGSYVRAMKMSRSNWISRRNWLISAGGLERPDTLSERPASFLMAFSENLAKNKQTAMDSLEVMKTWLRDLVIWKFKPEKIIHRDLTDKIRCASPRCDPLDLIEKMELISQTQKDISSNFNLRLCLDALMLRLASAS